MSKHRKPEWKAKSKRNRHNGHVNAVKRQIISKGEHFESRGRNYFIQNVANVSLDIGTLLHPERVMVARYQIVCADRRV